MCASWMPNFSHSCEVKVGFFVCEVKVVLLVCEVKVACLVDLFVSLDAKLQPLLVGEGRLVVLFVLLLCFVFLFVR